MSASFARLFTGLLLVVHAGLGACAFVRFLELGLLRVPWGRVSNPLFSVPMLLLQWTLVAGAAATFVIG